MVDADGNVIVEKKSPDFYSRINLEVKGLGDVITQHIISSWGTEIENIVKDTVNDFMISWKPKLTEMVRVYADGAMHKLLHDVMEHSITYNPKLRQYLDYKMNEIIEETIQSFIKTGKSILSKGDKK